jgi:D-alanyl-D-alanine carboxypeptidase
MIFARASVPTPEVPTTEVTVSTIATTAPVETIEPETLPAVVVQPARSRPEPDPNYQLTARHAFVYDCNSDTLRFSLGNMDDQIAPASLTKLLTAYVALQYLDPQTVITCGKETTWIDPASSVSWVSPGDKVTVELLIQGMMMQSGNDAAYATAVAAGRVLAEDPKMDAKKALAVFMDEVNAQAQILGLTGTHFSTPDGLDAFDHYTTTQDMLTISLLAMNHPLLRHYSSLAQTSVMYDNGETYTYRSTNYLLWSESKYYCEDACGMKTGTTKKAGSCLMSLFYNGDGYILIGVFGCPQYEDRFADALQLYALYG